MSLNHKEAFVLCVGLSTATLLFLRRLRTKSINDRMSTNSRSTSSRQLSKRLIPADEALPCENRRQFSLLSYNILSYKYLCPDSPSFVAKSPEKLDWSHRRERIIELLKRSEADVICLQEVETPTFGGDFGDDLSELGYSYVVQKMKNSKKKAHPHTTGVATLYRSSKFICEWENHRSRTLLVGLRPVGAVTSASEHSAGCDDVSSSSSVSSIAVESRQLAHHSKLSNGSALDMEESKDVSSEEKDDELVYVANCHLEGHPSVENTRFNQLRSLFTQLELHQRQRKRECRESRVIVCGDFNCCKDSRVYELMSTGKLEGGCTDRFYPEVVVTEKDYSHPFPFRHAYEGLAEQYATYARSPGWSTIDFIWYSTKALENVATREVIPPLKMAELIRSGSGIPNLEQPSDHMPIAAVFQLIK